jgi:hypothetical protein
MNRQTSTLFANVPQALREVINEFLRIFVGDPTRPTHYTGLHAFAKNRNVGKLAYIVIHGKIPSL